MANKRAVNVSIDADLVAEAKAFGTNISAVLEAALKAAHRERRAEQWRAENQTAIAASNAELETHGAWFRPDWAD
jgi:antitoxin CcdA